MSFLVKTFGQLDAGKSQYEAAQENAQLVLAEGTIEEARRRRVGEKYISSLRSRIGKSGVAFTGTPIDVLAESAANAEVDAMNAAWSARNRAKVIKREGKMAKKASYYQAGTSLLSGVEQFFIGGV